MTEPAIDLRQERAAALARKRLIYFCEATKPDYEAKWFHKAIARALEAVQRGEIRNLIIQAPPRVGKSELASVRFPVWALGHNPASSTILCTYNDFLASKFGSESRDLAMLANRMGIFPNLKLKQDSQSKTFWSLAKFKNQHGEWQDGGYCVFTGIGGAITGMGAHRLIIEDPVKNQEEANSQLQRDKVWEFYNSVAKTRLEKGASKIVIMTRWHEDDLVGRLLANEPGEWTVLSYPMLAEQDEPKRKAGDCLYPAKWSQEEVEKLRASYQTTPAGRQTWAALYQQRPYCDGGGHFLLANWQYFNGDPIKTFRRVQTWDTAFKTGRENDYTVCLTIDQGQTGHYIQDRYRAKIEFPALIAAMKAKYEQFKPSLVLIEDNASGQSAIQVLKRETAIPILAIKADTDKLSRAQTAITWQSTGRIYIPKNASWLDEFISEYAAFPNGLHDDQVDPLSQYCNWAQRNGGRLTFAAPGGN